MPICIPWQELIYLLLIRPVSPTPRYVKHHPQNAIVSLKQRSQFQLTILDTSPKLKAVHLFFAPQYPSKHQNPRNQYVLPRKFITFTNIQYCQSSSSFQRTVSFLCKSTIPYKSAPNVDSDVLVKATSIRMSEIFLKYVNS